ncbi:hypothetical protein H5407_16940 [Mitsuaria sp. WAJ17]|uniref:hypothetical protein n=1 Tax=Mitsuaria sp. WAJ17 TaxID=2761452 RepID=UPI001601A4F2|nr:hypothetical protein [Mitsuaria sp. WAJ17]MBB2486917.1 hypothetical protein [Mitsuaria sp. WAJ17]
MTARLLSWQPILVLRLRHGYFADGRPRRLRLRASPDTQAFIARHQLVERCDGSELWLHVPAERMALLWSERLQLDGSPRRLRWLLEAADPDYALYTDRRAPREVSAPVLDVPPGGDAQSALLGAPADLSIELKPRLCTWKYLLLGDWDAAQPALEMAGQPDAFRRDEDERLPDGRMAWVFRSRRRWPLGAHGPQHLVLKDLAGRHERVLQARLPLAAPRGLILEKRHGRTRPVSEIFVHP